MSDFVWPSDMDRAEDEELNRVCEELEEIIDERDGLAADRADLIRELACCQRMLHSLARAGECSPEYPDDARLVLERVTGGKAPDFQDKRGEQS